MDLNRALRNIYIPRGPIPRLGMDFYPAASQQDDRYLKCAGRAGGAGCGIPTPSATRSLWERWTAGRDVPCRRFGGASSAHKQTLSRNQSVQRSASRRPRPTRATPPPARPAALHHDASADATPSDINLSRKGGVMTQGRRVNLCAIQQSQDAHRAQGLVQQLARGRWTHRRWGAATAVSGAVCTIAKGPQRSGAAMMTWSSGPSGTQVLFYCTEALAGAYRAETDT